MGKKITAEQSRHIASAITEYMKSTKGLGFELANELRTYLLNNSSRKIPRKFQEIFKDMKYTNSIGIIFI